MRSRAEHGIDVSHLSVYAVEIGSEAESLGERFVLEMSDEQAILIHRVPFAGIEPMNYGFDD